MVTQKRCASKDQSLLFDLYIGHLTRSTAVTNRIIFSEKTYCPTFFPFIIRIRIQFIFLFLKLPGCLCSPCVATQSPPTPLYPPLVCTSTVHCTMYIIVLILDGNSQHVAHTSRKIGLFGEKNRFVTTLDQMH